ncbi:hypothetical protein [Corynebacterium phoceense]|uniref:hypothetical protein n=1 Tax=Corynebacterium phoceense TaxID=1686286 RepID=UPI00211C2713|nr:hypothetical protein [Corynebacterium phoceense]MCQ9331076.1 hypothetical protein [Corynebacterium phoceense]
MAVILLLLALLTGGAGAYLWWLSGRPASDAPAQRPAVSGTSAEARDAETAPEEAQESEEDDFFGEWSDDSHDLQDAPSDAPVTEAEQAEQAEATEEAGDEDDNTAKVSEEPTPIIDADPAPTHGRHAAWTDDADDDVSDTNDVADDATDNPDNTESIDEESNADSNLESDLGDDAEDAEDTAAEPELIRGRRSLLGSLPGAVARERRAWAAARDYDFAKQDEYLVDEFTRGAAAGGAAPHDVVAGRVLGHEMLLMDIGGVNVMAMRTGAASDIVVDFRRTGALEDTGADDLVPAFEAQGFSVYASDAAVAERLIDARVRTALDSFPHEVTAVWMESEWVLAQMTKDARAVEWDAMQAPLALLADCARVLPPRSQAAQVLRLGDGDPTRSMEQEAVTLASGPALVAPERDEFEYPPVERPEEPVPMPTRVTSDVRGPVERTALGADEVDAIADGKDRPDIDERAPRVRRHLDGKSSIFGDD